MAIIPVFIPHAGCPHQCVFCNQKTISGQQTASSRDVEQQLERYLQWIKPGPFNEAAFYGVHLQGPTSHGVCSRVSSCAAFSSITTSIFWCAWRYEAGT